MTIVNGKSAYGQALKSSQHQRLCERVRLAGGALTSQTFSLKESKTFCVQTRSTDSAAPCIVKLEPSNRRMTCLLTNARAQYQSQFTPTKLVFGCICTKIGEGCISDQALKDQLKCRGVLSGQTRNDA